MEENAKRDKDDRRICEEIRVAIVINETSEYD